MKWTRHARGPERVHRGRRSRTASGTSARSGSRGLRPRHARAPAGGHGRRPVPRGRQARALGRPPEGGGLLLSRGVGRDGRVRRRRRLAARLPRRQARHARGDASAGGACGASTPGSRRRSSAAARTCAGTARTASAGDASLYGSVEARLWLFRGRLIAPGRWGVFGLADTGRVFLEGESSDTWHTSYGRGDLLPDAARSTPSSTPPSPTATTARASTWATALRSEAAAPAARLGRAAAPGGAPALLRARGRGPGHPLLVHPVRAGRPARGGAAHRGRARPLRHLLQPGRPLAAQRVVVPALDGVGAVGGRLHRGPAGPRGARHVLVALRRRPLAPRRRPAPLARRGHAPRLVLPHPAEARRAARPAA